MTNNPDQITQLLEKLEILLKRQDDFNREINTLRVEISRLTITSTEQQTKKEETKQEKIETRHKVIIENEKVESPPVFVQRRPHTTAGANVPTVQKPLKVKSDLEKFIGENLINKIGIAITVIGVAIGAKYAIDRQLISPLTRIILGYMMGAGLLAFAIKLKKNYASFSAVLLSGAMAIMYFITYSAYSLYGLMSQPFAFVLMLVFTVFTVLAATTYNKQVIAQIGLVGAYAVPFLLSEGSGKVAILFAYMAIINAGILVIAFKRYWKALYYSSFVITWLIYFSWFVSRYQAKEHFSIALSFLVIFFITFYLIFLAYKLIRKEKFEIGDIILLLANSFIFYGIGYALLETHDSGARLLGVFSLCNALVHFIVSGIIYRQKLADRNLFYLVSGLVLVFTTIAIPVQLNGNWVTLLWAGEAALLFWIGRTKNGPLYEKLSYVLMILAFFSIIHDWITVYDRFYTGATDSRITPFLNITFLSSLLFIAAFAFINWVNRNKNYSPQLESQKGLARISSFFIPGILLFTIYFAFRMEIANYWDQLYADSVSKLPAGGQPNPGYQSNYDLTHFKTIWIINYSLLFVSLMAFVNFRKFKNRQLGLVNLGLIALAVAVFLTQGLYVLSELRVSYLVKSPSQLYHAGSFNIWIRYVSFAFVALSLFAFYTYIRRSFMQSDFKIAFDFLLHVSVLWTASSELINWMELAGSVQSHKLGLSILWGVYSLLLISLGIAKKKKHLRVGAIVLFGVTLVKLFFYDISDYDTLSKTIVFVSLGILLLIISFLYNKYTHRISDEGGH